MCHRLLAKVFPCNASHSHRSKQPSSRFLYAEAQTGKALTSLQLYFSLRSAVQVNLFVAQFFLRFRTFQVVYFVLAKLAKKSNVGIGINFDEIVNSTGLKKSEILARVGQNIRLCNKNKIKMKFISFRKENERNIHDLKALGLVLGMPTWMTKNL